MNSDVIKKLFVSLHGQKHSIVIPRPYIEATGGDLKVALFINELVYLSDRGGSGDGSFYKSYPDWEESICLTKDETARAAEWCKKAGFLQTTLKKAGSAPTLHYHFDLEKFLVWISGKPISDIGKAEDDLGKAEIHIGKAEVLYKVTPSSQHLNTTPSPAAHAADLPQAKLSHTIERAFLQTTGQSLKLRAGSPWLARTLKIVNIVGQDTFLEAARAGGYSTYQQLMDSIQIPTRAAPVVQVSPGLADHPREEKPPQASPDLLRQVAQRIHERHPEHRTCSLRIVENQLRAVLKKYPDVDLNRIDSQHEKWCESDDWIDDEGQYVKSLKAWLDPEAELWENNPKSVYVSPYEDWQEAEARQAREDPEHYKWQQERKAILKARNARTQ